MDKVRTALIGAGNMANAVHYPSLSSFEDVEIVGLCDINQERLAQTAQRFSIEKTFTDHKRMLDKTDPDAVYALMPPHVLFDVAADVLERGKHLFIEKPPGVTTFQAESLAQLAAGQNLITAVGFQRRYQPLLNRCWEEDSKKGPVHLTVANFYKNVAPSQRSYYRGALDVLRCDSIHSVDLLRYYCGLSEVKSVASEVRDLDASCATSFSAIVHFENDSVGVLLANWRTGRRFFKCEFHSCGASAFADADEKGEVWADNVREPALSMTYAQAAGSDEGHIAQGFRAENRAFVDAVKDDRQVHNNLADSAKTMRLADMIYENAINRSDTRA